MTRQYYVAPIPPFHVADGTPAANSTSLTDITPSPAVVIPAGMLEAGTRLEWYAFGRYSNTGTPTLTLGMYSGTIGQAIGSAVALCSTAAMTTPTTVTNRTWRIEGHASIRSVGASGTILGMFECSNVTTAGTDMAPATAPATATIDTGVSRYFALGATWNAASASNTITCHYFGVRVVN